MAPRGRPQQAFNRTPENAAEARKMRRAVASAHASAEKLRSIEHMMVLARKEMCRIIDHAAQVGVTHSELGRIYGLSTARIGQLINEHKRERGTDSE